MSIYSGFSTRQLEQNYNNVLLKIIYLLQAQILENISKEENLPGFPSKKLLMFSSRIIKLISKLKSYEERKYNPPKYSRALEKLSQKFSDCNLMKPHSYQHELNQSTQKLDQIILIPKATFGKYEDSEKIETDQHEKSSEILPDKQIKPQKLNKQTEQKWASLADSKVSSNSKTEIGNKNFKTQLKNNQKNINYFEKNFTSPTYNQFEPQKPRLGFLQIAREKLISTSQNTRNNNQNQQRELKGFSKKIQTRNPIIFNIHNKKHKPIDSNKKRVKTQYEQTSNIERCFDIR